MKYNSLKKVLSVLNYDSVRPDNDLTLANHAGNNFAYIAKVSDLKGSKNHSHKSSESVPFEYIRGELIRFPIDIKPKR